MFLVNTSIYSKSTSLERFQWIKVGSFILEHRFRLMPFFKKKKNIDFVFILDYMFRSKEKLKRWHSIKKLKQHHLKFIHILKEISYVLIGIQVT